MQKIVLWIHRKVSNGVLWLYADGCRDARLPTAAGDLFSEAERAEIAAMIAVDPECGEVIQGTGGFRKVRVGRSGMGKRGGARVIYILRNEAFPIFLITAYAKNEKDNLTKKERNELAKRADEIFAEYRR